jgi:uncharacterized membrane protein
MSNASQYLAKITRARRDQIVPNRIKTRASHTFGVDPSEYDGRITFDKFGEITEEHQTFQSPLEKETTDEAEYYRTLKEGL